MRALLEVDIQALQELPELEALLTPEFDDLAACAFTCTITCTRSTGS